MNSERSFPVIHFPTSPFQQLGRGQNCCLHYQTRQTYVIGSSILELVEGKCYRKPLHLRLNICTCPLQFLQSVIDYYIPYHPIIPSLWLGLFITCIDKPVCLVPYDGMIWDDIGVFNPRSSYPHYVWVHKQKVVTCIDLLKF